MPAEKKHHKIYVLLTANEFLKANLTYLCDLSSLRYHQIIRNILGMQ